MLVVRNNFEALIVWEEIRVVHTSAWNQMNEMRGQGRRLVLILSQALPRPMPSHVVVEKQQICVCG